MKARVGSVPYLNAKPLTEGLDAVIYEVPSRLAECLRRGELDAALVPILEVLEWPNYEIVEGCAIGSEREVKSVFLTYPLHEKVRIATDIESKTSVALAKIILEKDLNFKAQWVEPEEKFEAQLMIGDRALNFRKNYPQTPVLDLAQAWYQKRQLPFVFAVWAIRSEFQEKQALAERLRETKEKGVKQVEKYTASIEEEIYLKKNISYELGVLEKKAILRFQEELLSLGLIKERLALHWL
ncbi:MAG: menaquinone biosynthesis protein [Verrucomicrobiae bacterium]|nr:menaquinone biosynthesis protein [Verrucomicrobiae bacterium]